MPPLLAVCLGALSMAPSSQLPTPGGPVPTDPTDLPRSPSRFSQHLCLKNSLIVKSTGFPQQDLGVSKFKSIPELPWQTGVSFGNPCASISTSL